VRGFGVAPKLAAGEPISENVIRFLVTNKLSPGVLAERGVGAVPKKLGAVATDVVAAFDATTSEPPGTAVKHAIAGELGSLACVMDRNGIRIALAASHVVAPPSVFPLAGDDVWVGGAPRADLRAWTALSAFATVHADVAVSDTALAVTATWPDGAAFGGARDYAPANGPFTFYGFVSGARTAMGQPILGSTVSLAVPLVGPVSYVGHALLDVASQGGDSGAAVRDAAGFLVGLVVGCTSTAQACVTPWQSLGPAIDQLLT